MKTLITLISLLSVQSFGMPVKFEYMEPEPVEIHKADTMQYYRSADIALYIQDTISFKRLVVDIADSLGCKYEDILTIFYFESRLNPAAKNPNSSAKGLFQAISSTRRMLNMNMSELGQVVGFKKYLELTAKNRKLTLLNMYLAVHYPISLDGRNVVYSKEANPSCYYGNMLFDTNKDGLVTRSEINSYINRYDISGKKTI